MRREKFEGVCKLRRILGSKKLNRHQKKGREEGRKCGREGNWWDRFSGKTLRVQWAGGSRKILKQRGKILSESPSEGLNFDAYDSIGPLKEEVDFQGSSRSPSWAFGLSLAMSSMMNKTDSCKMTSHSWEGTKYQFGRPIQHPIVANDSLLLNQILILPCRMRAEWLWRDPGVVLNVT